MRSAQALRYDELLVPLTRRAKWQLVGKNTSANEGLCLEIMAEAKAQYIL